MLVKETHTLHRGNSEVLMYTRLHQQQECLPEPLSVEPTEHDGSLWFYFNTYEYPAIKGDVIEITFEEAKMAPTYKAGKSEYATCSRCKDLEASNTYLLNIIDGNNVSNESLRRALEAEENANRVLREALRVHGEEALLVSDDNRIFRKVLQEMR